MIGYGSYGELSLFFTLIGLLNLFLLWPFVLLLYFTGTETLVWSAIPWIPLSAAACLSLTANLMTYIGLQWTYEVFLSTGLVLAIPISSGEISLLLPHQSYKLHGEGHFHRRLHRLRRDYRLTTIPDLLHECESTISSV